MISACTPHVPTSTALVETLNRPPPVVAEDQAFRLPDSKPSAKITGTDVAVGVLVGGGVFVGVAVGMAVAVGVFVGGSGVAVAVGVFVGVEVDVGVGVSVGTAVGVLVGVEVGVGVSVGNGVGVGVAVGVEVSLATDVAVGVKLGVAVALFGSELYAASTSMRPAPNVLSAPAAPRSMAVEARAARCCATVRFGKALSSSASAPETCGAASDVPETQ